KNLKDLTIKSLAYTRDLDIKTLEKISFYQAVELNTIENIDSVSEKISQENSNSKYSKIAQAQKQASSSKSIRPLTDENFSYFMLYDLVDKHDFISNYETEKETLLAKRDGKSSTTVNHVEKKKKGEKEINELLLIQTDV